MNKVKLLIPIFAFAVAGATLLTTTTTYAQEESNPINTLVQRVAERFGLNQDDVQAVFDEHREEMHSQREDNYEARLDEAVANGELTAEQKQLILDKHAELQASMETNKANFEAHHQEMITKHESLESWAEENGIDMKYLGFAMKVHGDPGMGFKHVMRFDDAENSVFISE